MCRLLGRKRRFHESIGRPRSRRRKNLYHAWDVFPQESQRQYDRLTISGWCFHTDSEIESVELRLEGRDYRFQQHLDRPDVAIAYPQFSSSRNSGIYLTLSLEEAGELDYLVSVRLASGGSIDLERGALRVEAIDEDAEQRSAPPRWGVNLIGHLESEKGVGEIARSDLRALQEGGVPVVLNAFRDPQSSNREIPDASFSDENPYAVNLVHVNPPVLPLLIETKGLDYFRQRYNIAHWFWETRPFPRSQRFAFQYFDEIWASTSHIEEILAEVSPVPVTRIPPVVESPPQPGPWGRSHFGIPEDGFIFFFNFSLGGTLARKNPLGLIDAFRRAFSGREKVFLLLKVSHGENYPDAYRELMAAIDGESSIIPCTRYLTRDELGTLYSLVDCYVSLHRAEGLGLTLVEAMSHGLPVISTGYSGNMDFTKPEHTFLVDYRLAELDRDCGPYRRGARWAEPDLEDAIETMRLVRRDHDLAKARGSQAGKWLCNEFSPARVGKVAKERLETLRLLGKLPV